MTIVLYVLLGIILLAFLAVLGFLAYIGYKAIQIFDWKYLKHLQ